MKYICEDCGEIFYENEIIIKTYYDNVEFWGEKIKMPYETCKCPYCHSEEIYEWNEER